MVDVTAVFVAYPRSMPDRRCLTPSCEATLAQTGPRARRLYCDDCRRKRAVEARDRFKDRGGAPAVRAEGLQRRATLVWLCEALSQATCAFCPERRIAALQFYRPNEDDLPVGELVSRGVHLARIQAAVADAIAVCASCYAVRQAAATGSYRHQYVLDVQANRPPLLGYVGPRARRKRGRPVASTAAALAATPPPAPAPKPPPRPVAASPAPAGPRLKPRPPWALAAPQGDAPSLGVFTRRPGEHERRGGTVTEVPVPGASAADLVTDD